MGYLTTITIYNDGIDQIKKDPVKFAEGVYEAATSMRGPVTFGVGNHSNLVKVHRTRHADDPTVYVHMGNTVCEMNGYSDETLRIMEGSPKFFEKMLDELTMQVKMLKSQLKEYKEDQNGNHANR